MLTVAARVVGDARGSQLCEACLTPAAVPAGAFTAQAALVTPAGEHGFPDGKETQSLQAPSQSPPALPHCTPWL